MSEASKSSTVDTEEVVLDDCMLESELELENLSGWIWCSEARGQAFLAESDFWFFFEATLLQVRAMTMMTMASREPPIDAEMMMSSGSDSEMEENEHKKYVCQFLSPSTPDDSPPTLKTILVITGQKTIL